MFVWYDLFICDTESESDEEVFNSGMIISCVYEYILLLNNHLQQ